MNKEVGAFIAKCKWNEKIQELKVFFHSDTEGAAFRQPLTFRENGWDREACKFFKDWPAFTKEELWKAIEKYNSRERRYGGVKEEQHV